jgi:dihydropteroate synthase
LIAQLINISNPLVFKKYGNKYKIFRELYEKDLFALELRGLVQSQKEKLKTYFLENKEICYSVLRNDSNIDFCVIGALSKLKELSKEIHSFSTGDEAYKVAKAFRNFCGYEKEGVRIGDKSFLPEKHLIMGILNVTPDSFSDGGLYSDIESAVKRGMEIIGEGADILDIGGESTRPGAEEVPLKEELQRVIPVIARIRELNNNILISVDTTKSEVAGEALKKGANIINDISGLSFDPAMPEVVKAHNASLVIMHIKGEPRTMQESPFYNEVISEIYDFLETRIEMAEKKGVQNIIVDPGIGFGKRLIDNYEIINRLSDFKSLGFPILVGTSRKAFIGKVLQNEPVERDFASSIADCASIMNGAKIIRTHNVKNAVQAKEIISRIKQPGIVN